MTIQEKREELIVKYKARQTNSLYAYIKKLNCMVAAQIEQEYDTVILGKEYKPKKKEKKVFKEKVTYENDKDDLPKW